MRITLRYWRRSIMWSLLGGVAALSVAASFLLRFDFQIPAEETRHLGVGLLIALAAKLIVFHLFRCDRGGWRYTGLADISTLVMANVIGSVAFVAGAYATFGATFPRSIYCIDFLICFPV